MRLRELSPRQDFCGRHLDQQNPPIEFLVHYGIAVNVSRVFLEDSIQSSSRWIDKSALARFQRTDHYIFSVCSGLEIRGVGEPRIRQMFSTGKLQQRRLRGIERIEAQ